MEALPSRVRWSAKDVRRAKIAESYGPARAGMNNDHHHVALRRLDGGHADDGSARSCPVDPCAAEPVFSELPFGCSHDQRSPVLVLGIDRWPFHPLDPNDWRRYGAHPISLSPPETARFSQLSVSIAHARACHATHQCARARFGLFPPKRIQPSRRLGMTRRSQSSV
jgi:hypothetical protein